MGEAQEFQAFLTKSRVPETEKVLKNIHLMNTTIREDYITLI